VRERLNSKPLRVPGAAQREAVRCRPGTLPEAVSLMIPDLRRIIPLRVMLRHTRDTRECHPRTVPIPPT
jgi:hypothetical protein